MPGAFTNFRAIADFLPATIWLKWLNNKTLVFLFSRLRGKLYFTIVFFNLCVAFLEDIQQWSLIFFISKKGTMLVFCKKFRSESGFRVVQIQTKYSHRTWAFDVWKFLGFGEKYGAEYQDFSPKVLSVPIFLQMDFQSILHYLKSSEIQVMLFAIRNSWTSKKRRHESFRHVYHQKIFGACKRALQPYLIIALWKMFGFHEMCVVSQFFWCCKGPYSYLGMRTDSFCTMFSGKRSGLVSVSL